ncbi:hypothetical protein [Stenotrophomonas sp. Leaf70]|uniref:hypothetical protein n=1 Tax=Stenotrophomonas sp. Leaf70 TaxID=1736233 RepID=UPI000A5960E5|nr:hypothetical protein [Stenotrophomonas sp. Leaf70]
MARRYFNAAGATEDARICKSQACETRSIFNVLCSVLKNGPVLKIFGGSSLTPDGISMRQVIAAASAVTVRVVPWETAPRRAGDPAALVASSGRARAELGWSPAWTSLEAII